MSQDIKIVAQTSPAQPEPAEHHSAELAPTSSVESNRDCSSPSSLLSEPKDNKTRWEVTTQTAENKTEEQETEEEDFGFISYEIEDTKHPSPMLDIVELKDAVMSLAEGLVPTDMVASVEINGKPKATGFFAVADVQHTIPIPLLLTNRHVISNPYVLQKQKVEFVFRRGRVDEFRLKLKAEKVFLPAYFDADYVIYFLGDEEETALKKHIISPVCIEDGVEEPGLDDEVIIVGYHDARELKITLGKVTPRSTRDPYEISYTGSVPPITTPGSSGSLVLSMVSLLPVAIHFAGDGELLGFAHSIHCIANDLKYRYQFAIKCSKNPFDHPEFEILTRKLQVHVESKDHVKTLLIGGTVTMGGLLIACIVDKNPTRRRMYVLLFVIVALATGIFASVTHPSPSPQIINLPRQSPHQ